MSPALTRGPSASGASVHDVTTDTTTQQRAVGSAGWSARFGLVLIVVWLVFLVPAFGRAWATGVAGGGWGGCLALIAFSLAYVGTLAGSAELRRRGDSVRVGVAWLCWATVAGLGVAVLAWVGPSAGAVAIFTAATAVEVLPPGQALGVGVLLVVGNEAARAFGGWTSDASVSFGIAAVVSVLLGWRHLVARNHDLHEAREELARLAVVEERERFSRDLHDILGHSLTVIAIKAELAGKVVRHDPARAEAELADLESLARDALAEVRHAVGGYRGIDLATELGRAQIALDAAGVALHAPDSVPLIPDDRHEVFAWAVREGVTNVVRHAHAMTCRISLDARRVQIADDGVGTQEAPEGNGLMGLRERAHTYGARVIVSALNPGCLLTVEFA